MPPRSDGRPVEADLVLLQDLLAEKENEIEREINTKIEQHKKWNEGHIDMTRAPLTPPLEEQMSSTFRTAMTEYLPTPPASVSSEHSGDAVADLPSPSHVKGDSVAVRYASPSYDVSIRSRPSFRRRVGRGGRLMIDRRGMHMQSKEGLDDMIVDRFKYDRDDDDEEEVPIYPVDPYEIANMRYRAAITGSPQTHPSIQAARRAQLESAASNPQAAANPTNSSALPRQQSSD